MKTTLNFVGWGFTGLFGLVTLGSVMSGSSLAAIGFGCVAIGSLPLISRWAKPREVIPLRILTIILGVILVGTNPSAQTTASTPRKAVATPQPVQQTVSCERAGGRIWSGVTLYGDAGCKHSFGTIIGGGTQDGREVVQIHFEQGDIELKSRAVVRDQAFVMSNDPAIARQQWMEIQP